MRPGRESGIAWKTDMEIDEDMLADIDPEALAADINLDALAVDIDVDALAADIDVRALDAQAAKPPPARFEVPAGSHAARRTPPLAEAREEPPSQPPSGGAAPEEPAPQIQPEPAPPPRTALALAPGARPGGRLALIQDPYDPRSEKVRALRTELMLRHEAKDLADVLALLSPGSGEGRSQLAAELAIAFAQLGRPTLLVDADMRRPIQHLLFRADNESGLAQALTSGQKPQLHSVEGMEALALLTAGRPPHNPLELLSDRHFERLVEEWRREFDFVVIDTPPVDRYADGLAVATVVGRVLAVSRSHHSSQRDTREMLRRLGATQSRILGAVINHF